MLIKAENTAAIIVDVQEKLMPAMFNQEEVEKNVNRLVAGLKLLEVPMIVTQQYTKGIGMTIPSVIETFGDVSAQEWDIPPRKQLLFIWTLWITR